MRTPRGGADVDDSEGDEDDDDEDDFVDDDDDMAFEEDGVNEADFEGSDTVKGRAIKAWSALEAGQVAVVAASGTTPPMTQVYVGASLFLTVGAWMLNGNVWPGFEGRHDPKSTFSPGGSTSNGSRH